MLLELLEARMQRRQLHRNPRPFEQGARARNEVRYGLNCMAITLEIDACVDARDRGFTEHVEGKAKAALDQRPRLVERFLDGSTEHKMASQQADGPDDRLPDHGLAQARHHPAPDGVEVPMRGFARLDELASDHQRPGRGIDEGRTRMT